MSGDLLGAQSLPIGTFCVCLLWTAVLLRAGPAIRHPHQRGLWLAVASSAVAMTLNLEPIRDHVTDATGSARFVVIARNQAGVVSAGAVLHFAAYAAGGRRRIGTVCVSIAVIMVTLLALVALGAVPPAGHDSAFTLDRASSATYWLLLVALHVVANVVCVRVCWRYRRRGPGGSLNPVLLLFGWGTAVAGTYWISILLLLAVGSRPGATLSLVLSLHAVLRAAALLVLTALEVRRALRHARTIWRIWPLWQDLVDAAPHVALSSSRHRLLSFLQPHVPWRLTAYRKVIEVRDAILVLGHYASPSVHRAARAEAHRAGVPGERVDAFVTAYVLSRARAAKLAGAEPDPDVTCEVLSTSKDDGGLAAETAFLLLVAEAYFSPRVRRRLLRRSGREPEHVLAFTAIATSLINYRRQLPTTHQVKRRPRNFGRAHDTDHPPAGTPSVNHPPEHCPKSFAGQKSIPKALTASAIMPTMDRTLRQKYPHHEWTAVSEGDSGAFVYHLTGEQQPELYAKVAPRTPENSAFDLAGEAERLTWLAEHGIPVPRIVEHGGDDTCSWLVTEAVRGVSAAEEWPEHQRFAVVEALAGLARTLHDLPVDECPFDQSLAVAVAEAHHNVREDLVDLDDLQEEHEGWSGEELLAELDRTRPTSEDLVVCHGDLCPNNVLLDPETCQVTGVIDVGQLGRADRHADLALAARELEIDEDPWFGPQHSERFLERYGLRHVDKDKMVFYQLLDEFF